MPELDKKLHVYKSSAGSGKTTALTIEYLKLALSNDYAFKHILALTFTNKAAQEMKERILEYLVILKDFKNDNLPFFLDDLINGIPKYLKKKEKEGKEEAINAIKEDTRKLFIRIIHNYSEFMVTTLDSFTNRLIRSFSHDLGLSFNYQVELDTTQLLKDAVDELVYRVGEHNDMLTQVLTKFSKQKIDNEKSRRIKNELEDRAKSLLSDVEEAHLIPLRSLTIESILELQKKIFIETNLIEKLWQNLGREFIDICKRNGIESKMFFHGKSGILSFFERLVQKDFSKLVPNKYVVETIEEQKWTSAAADVGIKNMIESVSDSLTNVYQQTIAIIEAEQSNYLLMNQIKNSIFPYMVLMELEKILEQIKQENQMVHISDFNKIISKEIAQESAPYIYERIGNRYQHYLLDEFQDTSVIQWHNLLPLIENSLSENFDNLIVGDSKQAIYRWRGSEVEQFSKLPELISENKDQLLLQREQMLKNNYAEKQLNTNYRSDKTIIDFNNKLFQFIKTQGYLNDASLYIYDNHWQESKNDKEMGMAEVHFIITPPKSAKEVYLDSYNQRTLEIILNARAKKYRFKDMAVLARNNTDVNSLAEYLLSKNIPIVSSESLFVGTSPQVQFMISIIKHVLQPAEYVFQVEIIRYLLENNRIKGRQIVNLSAELETLDPKDELKKYWILLGIEFDIPYLMAQEAYDALEIIARAFSVNTNESLTHFFIEAGFIFTKENHQGLNDFLIFWELKNKDFKLDIPEDWDAVRLMSFHKAKGLEFPVVINWFSQKLSPNKAGKSTVWINPELKKFPDLISYPFILSKLKDTAHHAFYETEVNKSIIDEINLFYVANTRPTSKLYVLVDAVPDKKSASLGVHFNELMNDFVSSENMINVEEAVYRMGADTEKDDSKSEEINSDEVLIMNTNITSDWNLNMTLALENDVESNKMAAWGQKVHLVLAEINTEDDIRIALKKLVYKGVIDDEEQEIINELALQVIHHPTLSPFYHIDAQVYNERDMVDNRGGIIRPDRLVILNDSVIVIDYKTGHPKEKDQYQIKNYSTQIGNHLQVDVSGYLVYLHEEIKIEEFKTIYDGKQ